MTTIRGRDGDLITLTDDTGPVCDCDGTGWAGTVQIDGRDVAKACPACKPHLAGRVPTVAQRVVGGRLVRQRRHLHAVR
jgi:hypothetical protein